VKCDPRVMLQSVLPHALGYSRHVRVGVEVIGARGSGQGRHSNQAGDPHTYSQHPVLLHTIGSYLSGVRVYISGVGVDYS